MNYVSKIIDSSELENIINLPIEYKNRKLEVLVMPVKEENNEYFPNQSLLGILSKYKNTSLIELENSAFSLAIKEKYGNS